MVSGKVLKLPVAAARRIPTLANLLLQCKIDQGNPSSRKEGQQDPHAFQIQWKTELAQAKEEMCFYWTPVWQASKM